MLSIALTEHLLLLMFQCCCCQHPYGHNQCYIVLKVAHDDTAEHTPKPVYNAEEAGEQGQEFGPDPTDPEGIAESPEPVDPDFPEPIKSKTAVVQPLMLAWRTSYSSPATLSSSTMRIVAATHASSAGVQTEESFPCPAVTKPHASECFAALMHAKFHALYSC